MALPKLLQELDRKLSLSGGTFDSETVLLNAQGTFFLGIGSQGPIMSAGNSYSEGAGLVLRAQTFSREPGAFALVTNNGTTKISLNGRPDGSLTWGGKPVLCGESGGFPVGFLALYAGSNVPDGWFRCDGSTVANMQTNYPKLYAVLGTNVLPNYLGRYPLGATAGINSLVEGGLPNIEGTATDNTYAGNSPKFSSAFKSSTIDSEHKTNLVWNDKNNQWSKFGNLVFKASDSNAVYGKSTTVTPPSVKCTFLIRHD